MSVPDSCTAAAGTTTHTSPIHVLVIPHPSQGHMIPILDLTQQLAARGLTITVLVTPKNLCMLDNLLSRHPSSIKPLVLSFPSHPSIPAGAENTKDMPASSFRALMVALGRLREPLIRWFESSLSPPSVIISDMFMGWTHDVACQLGIKRIVFSPSGALPLAVMYSLWRDMPRRRDDDGNGVVSFEDIPLPGCIKYPWWQISPTFRSYVEGEPESEFIKHGFRANMASWGLVINTFDEIERIYLSHLTSSLGHDRVWAVGPLLPPEDGVSQAERGGSSSVEVGEILGWLDACRPGEVIYVCFGSQAQMTNQQMDALALGLERSGAKFIWSVKEPVVVDNRDTDRGGSVPEGFESRVAGRGLVVRGWTPQVLILRHRAVGAFLTHCGWNSVLEGLVAGVTMLAWPMGADQFPNATLIVEQLKVGVRVCEGARTIPEPEKLARAVADSVREGIPERRRALEIREAALEGVSVGGRSFKDLDRMVKDMSALDGQERADIDIRSNERIAKQGHAVEC